MATTAPDAATRPAPAPQLIITVEADDELGWVARSEAVEEFGTGSSFTEAVEDLYTALLGLRDGLRQRRDRLSPEMRGHLEYLEHVLPE